MLHQNKPLNFKPDMQVSEGILEHEGKILLVKRSEHCSSPGTWSGPGGKLEVGESFDDALVRELQEEIGVDICNFPKEILFKKYFYFLEKHIEIQFYKIHCEEKPEIVLNDEHQDYIWIDPKDALKIHLTEDFDSVITDNIFTLKTAPKGAVL